MALNKVEKLNVTFVELLLLLFIALKLIGYINWSWWWVLSPALIPLTLILLIGIVIGLIGIVIGIHKLTS